MEQKIQRPITVRINDLKSDLTNAIQKSELPPFMLEMVVGEFLSGISMVARKEYEEDLESWEKSQKEKDGDIQNGE